MTANGDEQEHRELSSRRQTDGWRPSCWERRRGQGKGCLAPAGGGVGAGEWEGWADSEQDSSQTNQDACPRE